MQGADGPSGQVARLRKNAGVEYAEANRDFFKIYHSEPGNLTKAATSDREFQQLYLQQAKGVERPYCRTQ